MTEQRTSAKISSATIGPRPTDLSPTAQQILAAARDVVDRLGPDRLSLRAVASAARVPISLVIYHFGSMSRLETLTLDSLWRENVDRHLHDIQTAPNDVARRLDTLVTFHRRIAQDLNGYRTYFGLATHAIRNEETRRSVAKLYTWYRDSLNYPLLVADGYPEDQARRLAALTLATAEGLPLMCLLGASTSEMEGGFDLLETLLKPHTAVSIDPEGGMTSGASPTAGDHEPKAPSDGVPPVGTAAQLLTAGRFLLHDGGLKSLTLSNLASASGVSSSLVGYHFKNKHGYITSLFRGILDDWSHACVDACAQFTDPLRPTLADGLFGSRSPLAAAMIIQPALRRDSELAEYAHRRYEATVEQATDQLRTASDGDSPPPRTVAVVLIAALHGLVLQALYDPFEFDPRPALISLQPLLRLQHTAAA